MGRPMQVTLTINQTAHMFDLAPRIALPDAVRRHGAGCRHQEGLRPWPMRRLHAACGWPALPARLDKVLAGMIEAEREAQ